MNGKPVKSANILKIYDRLRQSPVTLEVLQRWVKSNGMDVSRRTLYRYLHTLAGSLSFPGEKVVVYDDEFGKKVWKIEYDESATSLSQFDINSYYILRNFIANSLSAPREDSLKKLDTMMYELSSKSRFQQNVDANHLAFTRSNYADTHYTAEQHALLEDLIWAIQHHRKIKVEEFAWDRALLPEGFTDGMMVLPLKLLYHITMIYICVYSEDTGKIIILPFHEILQMSATNISFKPASFLPFLEEYLSATFGILPNIDDAVYDIEIEFAGHTGGYVRRKQWHSSQSVEELENGNLLLKMKCGINRELIGFIVFFLTNAKVLKPLKLRNLVMAKLKGALEVYTQDDLMYKTNMLHADQELLADIA